MREDESNEMGLEEEEVEEEEDEDDDDDDDDDDDGDDDEKEDEKEDEEDDEEEDEEEDDEDDKEIGDEDEEEMIDTGSCLTTVTFESLGVAPALCAAMKTIGWTIPTEIQAASIPESIRGRDIIGLAETGSGKTGAFAIPIIQALLETPQRLFAVVLAPTRYSLKG